MDNGNDSIDDLAVRRATKHWPNDSRTLSISQAVVRKGVIEILVKLAVDPVTLNRLVEEPFRVTFQIEQELVAATGLTAETLAERVTKSLERILRRSGSLTYTTKSGGFVVLTYTP